MWRLCGSEQTWQLSVASVQLLGARSLLMHTGTPWERLPLFVGSWGDQRAHSALGCSLKSSITSPQIEVVFVLEMALFRMSVSNVLSRFGHAYPDIRGWAWSVLDLVSCCSGHPWESAVLEVRAFPAWGESSVHLCKMLLLSWWRCAPQEECLIFLKFSQFLCNISFLMTKCISKQAGLCATTENKTTVRACLDWIVRAHKGEPAKMIKTQAMYPCSRFAALIT